MSKQRPCGNPECGCSTGIHEGITYGSGRLDHNGYWEFPCRICAKEGDKQHKKSLREISAEYMRREFGRFDWRLFDEWSMFAPQFMDYMHQQHEWLFIPCWPFEGQDLAKLTKQFQEAEDRRDQFSREWCH